MACHNYHDVYGVFPPAYIADKDGRPLHSWRVLVLEFLDKDVYEQYDFRESWDGPHNRQLLDRMPRTYVFPGDNPQATSTTNYLAVIGKETVWQDDRSIRIQDIFHPDNTIMIVENRGSGILWTEPRDLAFGTMDFSLANDSPNGISSKFDRAAIATVDATVLRLERDVPSATVRAMLTRTSSDDVHDPGVVELPGGRDMGRIE